MIKKVLLIVLLMISFTNLSFATKLQADDKMALLDFGMRANSPTYSKELDEFAKLAPFYIRTEIIKDGRMNLLDGNFVSDKLANANIVVPMYLDKDTLKDIGKALGCRYLLLGGIQLTAEESGCWYYYGAVSCPPNLIRVKTFIHLRLVDTKKNKIINAAIGKGVCTNRYGDALVKIGIHNVSQETIKKSIEAASHEAVVKLIGRLFRKKK